MMMMMMMLLARKQHQSCVVCWLLEMRVVVGDRSSSQKGERTWLTQIERRNVLQVTFSFDSVLFVRQSVGHQFAACSPARPIG